MTKRDPDEASCQATWHGTFACTLDRFHFRDHEAHTTRRNHVAKRWPQTAGDLALKAGRLEVEIDHWRRLLAARPMHPAVVIWIALGSVAFGGAMDCALAHQWVAWAFLQLLGCAGLAPWAVRVYARLAFRCHIMHLKHRKADILLAILKLRAEETGHATA